MDCKIRKGKLLNTLKIRCQSIKVYTNGVASNGRYYRFGEKFYPPLIAMEYITKILKVLSKVNISIRSVSTTNGEKAWELYRSSN